MRAAVRRRRNDRFAGRGEGCVPAHAFPTLADGVLTIVAGESPVNFHSETPQGPYTGISYELVSEFAAENCLSLDVTLGTAGGSQLALQEGQADLMVTMAIATPERKQVFNLSDRILFEGMGIVSSDGSYKTVEDLKGRQIGVQTGASWGRSFASCTAAMSSSTPISPPSAPT
ncbi:substrate-binding periplasmic protein [Microbacterium suwonense]|uniref:Solute-binding protein family 3/N-terminal domain-containing protein n=1 Tax=Microbacterium suwonense TaxID=683047 RepID=A0ABN6X242_9MICO|nr:hypothetical protein GCM10025863_07820 [Microbacterium suwonense]